MLVSMEVSAGAAAAAAASSAVVVEYAFSLFSFPDRGFGWRWCYIRSVCITLYRGLGGRVRVWW